MKAKKMVLVTIVALGATNTFASGNGAGNGGVGYVCRDQSGNIARARLLDLWEPEGFHPSQTNAVTEEEQLTDAVEKIRVAHPDGLNYLEVYINQAKTSAFHVTKPLPLSNDALPDYAPEVGCKFEQVALYGWVNETGKYQLRIYDEIFLSPFFSLSDRAALWLHEGLYQIDSKFHDAQDSRRVRSINAEAFTATAGFSPLIAERLGSLMTFDVNSEVSISRDFTVFGKFVVAIDAFSNGTATCNLHFQENGKSLSLVPNLTTISISGTYHSGIIVKNEVPGLMDFKLDCDGVVKIMLKAFGRDGRDITDIVLGEGARGIYHGQNVLTGESLAPIHYNFSTFINP